MASIDGLNSDDPGIALLCDAVRDVPPHALLLVHCGDLPGLAPGALRLVLDVRERQGAVAELVEEGLGPRTLPRLAQHAVVWPRAHLGKDFTRWCIARAAQGVVDGGVVWCAVRKSKGAESVADELRRLVGPLDTVGRVKGYRLFRAERRGDRTAAWQEALGQRYTIEHVALGPDVTLQSCPGVFSRRALDEGTLALLTYLSTAAATMEAPAHVLDLCAGIGPLSIFAARRFPAAQVTAVESNLLAVSLLRHNVAACGVQAQVTVLASDGAPELGTRPPVQLALVNPPTHAGSDALDALWSGMGRWLAPTSRALVVATRAAGIREALVQRGATVSSTVAGTYTILDARWSSG